MSIFIQFTNHNQLHRKLLRRICLIEKHNLYENKKSGPETHFVLHSQLAKPALAAVLPPPDPENHLVRRLLRAAGKLTSATRGKSCRPGQLNSPTSLSSPN